MSFLIDNWFWLSAAVISGLGLMLPGLRGGPASALSVAEAVQLINREKAVVIDVSSAEEYASGHIAGARSVPLDQLAGAKALPSNKELPLVLVCASGQRARRAVATLTGQGHKRVHVLGGGLAAWREANLPVEKTA